MKAISKLLTNRLTGCNTLIAKTLEKKLEISTLPFVWELLVRKPERFE